jgi:hypothetical protein
MSEYPQQRTLAPRVGLALLLCATGVFIGWPPDSPWILSALFLGGVLIAALAVQSPGLPPQNLVGAGATLFALAALGDLLLSAAVIRWNSSGTPRPDGTALLPSIGLNALFWAAAVPSARGAAARLLKDHRSGRSPGVRLILAGALLAGLTRVMWTRVFDTGALSSAPQTLSATLTDFFVLRVLASLLPAFLFAALLLVSVTPWFLNKHPAPVEPNRKAVYVWLLLAITLAASAMRDPA